MHMVLNSKIRFAAAVGLFFGVGFASGWAAGNLFINNAVGRGSQSVVVRENDGNYKFVHKIIASEVPAAYIATQYKRIDSDVQNLIRDKESRRLADSISLYFNDFSNSQWFGVDETHIYDKASLSKVPIMMAYFKIADEDPTILKKVIVFNGPDADKSQLIKPALPLKIGEAYSVEDLIYRMIVDSDNNAAALLYNNIDKNNIAAIYKFAEVYLIENGISENGISPKAQSIFFRMLYNASYLSPVMSEKALELLDKTDFPQGMSAAVPAGVNVASKFAEREYANPQGYIESVELHECGIIYTPGRDLGLCIMTKGTNLSDLANAIKDITHLIYGEVLALQ